MSSTSKLLTPQWRIFPSRSSVSNASSVSSSGTRPRQCSRYRSSRSVFSRRRLASHAAIVPRLVAFCGITLLTRKISPRRSASASATSSSAAPSPYISAVSTTVIPRSTAICSAAISSARVFALIAHLPGADAERGMVLRPGAQSFGCQPYSFIIRPMKIRRLILVFFASLAAMPPWLASADRVLRRARPERLWSACTVR